MKLRIGILSTRGIPNRYGGFEQFASYLSQGLVMNGHEVCVYNSHQHPYKENNWNGVKIIRCYDPENWMGTAGQFIYDLNCIIDARKRKFDILLVLGYTSSSVWSWLYPKKSIIITNMDGLEWKRSKYAAPVQRFLQYAEKLAARWSDKHVADSIPIKEYLTEKYSINAEYISYGATLPERTDETILEQYGLIKNEYYLIMARMEPENHIETILDGLATNRKQRQVLVIGNTKNTYGKKMTGKFSEHQQIIFAGAVYDHIALDTLRTYCKIYFHGHSVGGTNPSLLEAMACGAMICAQDNAFNRAVLQDDAFYFYSYEDVLEIANTDVDETNRTRMIERSRQKILDHHSWDKIIGAYEQFFIQSYLTGK